jgi:hypothetical protein
MTGEPLRDLPARYLLDELEAGERVAVEDRLFADDEFFEEMLAVEGALAADYVSGRLSLEQREKFERLVAARPALAAEVDRARSLAGFLASGERDRELPARGPEFRSRRLPTALRAVPAWALAAAAVLAVTSWLAVEAIKTREHLAQVVASQALAVQEARTLAARVETQQSRHDQLLEGLSRAIQDIRPMAAVSFALWPGRVRAGTAVVNLAMPADADVVQLELHTSPDRRPSTPCVAIRTADATEVWSGAGRAGASPDAVAVVRVVVPAAALRPDDYIVVVGETTPQGCDEINSYSFRRVAR